MCISDFQCRFLLNIVNIEYNDAAADALFTIMQSASITDWDIIFKNYITIGK